MTERQKATRKLKKADREVTAHEGNNVPAELLAQKRNVEIEVNYTLYYPPGERYISLYKDAGTSTEKREMIKKDIGERMDKGTLGERTMEAPEQEERRPVKKAKSAAAVAAAAAAAPPKRAGGPTPAAPKVDDGKIEDDDFFDF